MIPVSLSPSMVRKISAVAGTNAADAKVFCFTNVKTIVKTRLTNANKAFAKMPTAANWGKLQVAMLSYQQVWQLDPVRCAKWHAHKANDLTLSLADKPICDWDITICYMTLGVSPGEALA